MKPLRGRGGTPRRGGSEGGRVLYVYAFVCGAASRSRGRRGCARGVSRTSPRGPRSHREADPFGHGNSVPLAPSPRAEVTRTRGPRPRRPPKPHARHPPAADGTDGQPPQPPSSRVVSSAPASDSAPPVKKTKKFRAVKIASPTPLRRAAATDAWDAPFSLVSSPQWARLSERLERRVSFTCLSNRSSRLVSLV